ncbi:MAG: glutaredoxin family protein [Vicinamibacterales bacterium]
MKQSCSLWAVWMTWLGLPTLAILIGLELGWWAGAAVLAAGAAGQWAYIRWFPSMSRWLGYGSVDDVPAGTLERDGGTLQRVTFYTASLCPFCPLLRARLRRIQKQLAFEIEEIDVTFRPEIVRAKGLRCVPVVEAGGRRLVGNATSEQLAALIRPAASANK